eukprot:scaffold5075_cov296-Prasinococcus_capsulatus_cf.AAC.10
MTPAGCLGVPRARLASTYSSIADDRGASALDLAQVLPIHDESELGAEGVMLLTIVVERILLASTSDGAYQDDEESEEKMVRVFQRIASVPELADMRQALAVFMHQHVPSAITAAAAAGPEEAKKRELLLTIRCKLARAALTRRAKT